MNSGFEYQLYLSFILVYITTNDPQYLELKIQFSWVSSTLMKLSWNWFENWSLKEQKRGLKEQRGGVIWTCKKLSELRIPILNVIKGVSNGFATPYSFYTQKLR